MNFYRLLKKVFDLLSHKERTESVFLIFFVIIGVLLESIGVVLILPITSLLIGSEIPNEFKFFENFLKDFEITENLLLVGMGVVVIVYVIKNLYLLLLHYYQIKFTQKISLRLSKGLFEKYINSEYSFYLNSNTSILIRNLQEAGSFESIYRRIISLITELIVTITFLVIFLIIDFKTTINITLIFVISGGLFILFFRNKITSWGQTRFEMTGKYLKTINQGLNGIKEIIFSNGQNFFVKKANQIRKKFLNTLLKIAVVDFIPRVLIEVLIIISVVITVINLSLSGKNYEYIVPLLAIYVAAAFRLAPACNKIINHVQSLKFSHASVTNLHEQLNLPSNEISINNSYQSEINKTKFNKSIEFNNVSFSFKERSEIYSNVNVKFDKNKIYGLKGNSGSGKSTFINLLTGLLKPSSGNILVDGQKLSDFDHSYLHENIAMVSQDVKLFNDTIYQNISYGNSAITNYRIDQVVSELNLRNTVFRNLPYGLHTSAGVQGSNLSNGQRQIILILRAYLQNKKIFILDEPTTALDPNTKKIVLDLIKQVSENKTTVIVTHDSETKNISNQIFELSK